MVDQARADAYNSWWQFRNDSWSRLEEAAARINSSRRRGKAIDKEMTDAVHEQCAALAPLEQFWAFPGHAAFGVVQELAAAGSWERLGRLVSRVNRALVTESYRTGSLDNIAYAEHRADDDDMVFGVSHDHSSRPYFEVLVVETMSPAQEEQLREEVHRWRRTGDPFIYDLVIVGSGVEAAVAMRLNANIQACVIRRRFSHAAVWDLTRLANFGDATLSNDLADHSPDERAQILAPRLAQIRPEVDMYLMSEIAVEDVAGQVSHHFRRVFHAREGALELHLTILAGVAERYRTPFFEALRTYSQRPTGVFHALPISQGKSIVNSHWIRDMVGFYGLDIFLAETSATTGGLDSLLEPTGQ
jgi:arginine decarboxylase